MRRRAKPVTATVAAGRTVVSKSPVRTTPTVPKLDARLAEAFAQQAATSEILRVISRSPTDVQPVFDTIAAAALKLCSGSSATVTRKSGEQVEVVALASWNPEAADAIRSAFPRPIGRDTAVTRALLTRSVVAISDVLQDPEYAIRDAAVAGGYRSAVAVPLMRDGYPIGSIAVVRPEPGAFEDKQVELLQTFANQAVIAIENVRLLNDTKEALEQQTATSEILRVISRSPTDVQPVFDTIVRSARALCDATFSGVFLLHGETLTLPAAQGMTQDELALFASGYPRKIGRDTVTGRAALDCRVVQTPDLISDPEYSSAPGVGVGARTVLGVPLIRDGKAIGALGVWRREIRAFSENQIALFQTFADQAVIAIENVRLFNETKEALERQTATAEILRVISRSPTDVQPVFDAIAAAALKLCEASSSAVLKFDGKLMWMAALANVGPEEAAAVWLRYPKPAGRETAASRAILSGSTVIVPDVLEDPEFEVRARSFRSVVSVPLLREGSPIGAITVGRPEPGRFPDAQIALLQTFADQAVIAIENVRLFTELEARTIQLTRSVGELKALGEVGQAVSSTLDLETVLNTIVSRATKLTGMDGGSIWEYNETREEFHVHATDRVPQSLIEAFRATPIRKGEGALGRMAITGEPVEIRDIERESSYQSRVRQGILRAGYRSVLTVPLLRESKILGALAVNRKVAGEFPPEVIDLLKRFATQSALAIQNARLFREIEDKSRQLEIASRHKSEFLANMSHELRTPLNAIIGFSEILSERLFGEVNDKQAEYLSDILDSGQHLLSLINDILDLSKIEAGRMELEPTDFNLTNAIESTLTLVRERAHRRAITLERRVDNRLSMICADERKVKQVLLNLLSNALKFTPEGGRIDVQAALRDGMAEISVTDTGVGIAPEDQAAVFEEFRQVGTASSKVEGTGLGLAISRKFIELHGGRIWVTSQVGAGSTFAFTLPLQRSIV